MQSETGNRIRFIVEWFESNANGSSPSEILWRTNVRYHYFTTAGLSLLIYYLILASQSGIGGTFYRKSIDQRRFVILLRFGEFFDDFRL